VLDYTFADADFADTGSADAGAEADQVWGRSLLAPLAPGALTPFTGSLLTEVAARAWYLYYDRLGFNPTSRARRVRSVAGRPYVNLSLSALLDAENAGLEPPSFRLDGTVRPLLAWEKPGFFANIKLSRGAKKIEETYKDLQQELPAITEKAAAWHAHVSGLRWSQAEVLQVMEEIERIGAAALLPYFAARHGLETACRRLLHLLGARPAAESTALIVRALGEVASTIELDMAHRVQTLGETGAAQQEVVAWLDVGDFADWEQTLPVGAFADGVHAFMTSYGHRGLHEGEIAAPRWRETPTSLFAAIRACAHMAVAPAPLSADSLSADSLSANLLSADAQPLLAAIDGKARKEAQQLVEQMRKLISLQSHGLHAFSFILAGTRRWALAAGHEAMTDHRITALEDIFYYELEEVKEMMTGEWNVSDRSGIHAAAAARRGAWENWRRIAPPALIWGERAARLQTTGLPAAGGARTGTAVTVESITIENGAVESAALPSDAVLVCEEPESALAALLPAAAAFVAVQGSPLDPLCACARSLGRPGVVATGSPFATISPSSRVTVDGNLGKATIL